MTLKTNKITIGSDRKLTTLKITKIFLQLHFLFMIFIKTI